MSSNANAEEAVMPRSVAVTVAHELLTAGHRYLDVRTVKEFSGGHAVEVCLCPFLTPICDTQSLNLLMQKLYDNIRKIILGGCLSGKRSLMAASELSNAGFTGITDVAGGFSAWVENGLPTEQKEPVRQSTCFL
ncbi:unnamed protein product [Musa acuminata subsp. malaccensis]|uniref:(wild Malaysian banana) hypothetical protein n=1 Tax=Musa acuminata subsp. malaccensis TaxID=214687 RepID=A0A8D7FTX3_MUSAM|nr:unnamed protein product [Musa acuminata subsp. malaccensis]